MNDLTSESNQSDERAQSGIGCDFRRISEFAHAEFGLSLSESKKSLVLSRVGRRLRALDVASIEEYLSVIRSGRFSDEVDNLLATLTTNVTKFFREDHHFHHLREVVVPSLTTKAKPGHRVRIWSAGCSSGQEAFSIVFTLFDAIPNLSRLDARILATDIDPTIVKKGIRARYNADELDAIPDKYHGPEFLTKGTDVEIEVCKNLRDIVSFGVLNLTRDLPFNGPFDAIFCRNVAIYFDKKTQEELWQRLTRVLADGGYLYIGHSERVSGPAKGILKNVGVTTYRKESFVV